MTFLRRKRKTSWKGEERRKPENAALREEKELEYRNQQRSQLDAVVTTTAENGERIAQIQAVVLALSRPRSKSKQQQTG